MTREQKLEAMEPGGCHLLSCRRQPRLSTDFETVDDLRSQPQWHADALRFLARQLGAANDFYFPLLGAAQLLDGKSASMRERELKNPEQR